MLQREAEHLPAGVDVADTPLVADADVGVERDVRAFPGQRPHRLGFEAVALVDTRNIVSPWCFGFSGLVRASKKM